MRLTESQSADGPGVLILQHNQYQNKFDLTARAMLLGARVVDRADTNNLLGHYKIGIDSQGVPVAGDAQGQMFWEAGPGRPMSSWSFAWAATIVKQSDPALSWGGAGPSKARPTQDKTGDDDRYASLRIDLPQGWNQPPADWRGIFISGTDENKQRELWHPADPRLIAANRGSNGAGDRVFGQPVVDITTENAIDKTRFGVLGEVLRVTQSDGRYKPAINGAWPSFFPVFGVAKTTAVACWGMTDKGGPFSVGSPNDQHRVRLNADLEPEQPLHLDPRTTIFHTAADRDAPIEIRDNIYPKVRRGAAAVPAYIDYDPTASHTILGKKYVGLRKLWAESSFQPPVITPSLITQVPPDNPPDDGDGGGGGGWWWWWLLIIINPEKKPIDTNKTPFETSAPSFHGLDTGAPRFSGIPGFQGAPIPKAPDPLGRDTDTPISPDDPRLTGAGAPADPVTGEAGFPPAAPVRDGDNGENTNFGWDWQKDDPSIGIEGDTTQDAEPPPVDRTYNPEPSSTPMVPGLVIPEWDKDLQYGWSMQTITARNTLGERISTYRPDMFAVNATTAAGTNWFTPFEVVWKAANPPTRISQATFALWNGIWPSTAASLGSPARFGALTPSQASGGGVDGWYLTSTGASGSVNAEFRFLDAAGAARAGTTSHYGHWSPGTDSTYSQGTAAVRWLTIHADNVGALSAPVDALYVTDATISGTLTTAGRIVSLTRRTTDLTLSTGHHYIAADTDGGALTMTLPASPTHGREYVIRNSGSSGNAVTVGRNGKTIQGASADITLADGESVTLVYESAEGDWGVY